MNEKHRWPHAEALSIAEEIRADLYPFCYKIEIAGSIRRKKADVGDIEILLIPKTEMRQVGLFDLEPFDLAHEELNRRLSCGWLEKRKGENGTTSWGPKNKLAIHTGTGIAVDFFTTTPENWWVSLVIRTGGKETNLKLTNGALAKGMHLNAYGSGITLQNQQVIPARGERHVFELCGVPYQQPEDRL